MGAENFSAARTMFSISSSLKPPLDSITTTEKKEKSRNKIIH